MKSDRRTQGRPKNPNIPPSDTTVRIKKETLDEVDRLINFQRMPLGQKIEHLVIEYKHLRKNLGGQPLINLLTTEERSLLINNDGNLNEPELSKDEYNEIWKQNFPDNKEIIDEVDDIPTDE